MFAWRKKPDGFEWHEYIRTAVKQRREARRERVHAARRAAGQNMNAAGVALAAGSRAAGSAARDGAVAGAGAIGLGLLNLWSLLVHGLRVATRPILNAVARPNIGGPVVLAGAIALGAGIGPLAWCRPRPRGGHDAGHRHRAHGGPGADAGRADELALAAPVGAIGQEQP